MAEQPSTPHFFRSKTSSFTSFGFFAVLSVILLTVDHKIQLMDPVRARLNDFTEVAHEVLVSPVKGIEALVDTFHAKATLEAENRKLKAENQKAQLDSMRFEDMKRENSALRKLLNAKNSTAAESRLFDVRNILSDGFSQFIVIDGGSVDGIKTGMPVMAGNGLAGQVSRVSTYTSLVRLIQDKGLSVPVLFERSQIPAIVQGAGDGKNLVTKDLRYTSSIKAGDKVITSGLDGIYPRGIPVGVVTSAKPSNNGIFSDVTIHNPATVDRDSSVLVLFVDTTKNFADEEEEEDEKPQQRRRAPRR